MTRFDFISSYSFNGKRRVNKNKKWGIINEKKEIVVPIEYDKLSFLKAHNLILFKRKKLSGIMDIDGNVIIKNMKLEYIHPRKNNTALLVLRNQDEKVGLYDTTGSQILAPEYEQINVLSDEIVTVKFKKNNKKIVINIVSMKAILVGYEVLSIFNSMIIVTNECGLYGAYDFSGKIIIPPEYYDFYHDRYNIVLHTYDGFDIYDIKGNYKKSIKGFKFILNLSETEMVVKRKGKLGVIDENDQIVIDTLYDNIDKVHEGVFDVALNCKHSLITKDKKMTPFVYSEIYPCEYNGKYFYCVEQDHKRYGVINEEGNEVIKIEFLGFSLDFIEEGYIVLKDKKGKYGLFDLSGNKILDTIYDEMYSSDTGKILVELGEELGFVELD